MNRMGGFSEGNDITKPCSSQQTSAQSENQSTNQARPHQDPVASASNDDQARTRIQAAGTVSSSGASNFSHPVELNQTTELIPAPRDPPPPYPGLPRSLSAHFRQRDFSSSPPPSQVVEREDQSRSFRAARVSGNIPTAVSLVQANL